MWWSRGSAASSRKSINHLHRTDDEKAALCAAFFCAALHPAGRNIVGKKWNLRVPVSLFPALLQTKEDTLKKILFVGALAFAAGSFAQSASAAEFYVVRDATTKKCTVVDTKPTTTTTTVVDNGTYKTKTEAETGMKSTKVCTE
jgi:hypothetical protein